VGGATGGLKGLQELRGLLGGPAVLLLQALKVSSPLGPGLAFLDGLGMRIDRLDVQAVLAGEGLERALRQVGHAHSVACLSGSRHLVRHTW
jgi:hypothetical protein